MALARSASGPGGLSLNTGAANLFGSSASQPPAGGGLFGSAAATTSQPAQSGRLFGSTTATPSATTSSQSDGTLFGSAAASQPAASGGMFGAANSAAKPSLFGSATPAATTAPPAGGLFGAPAAQQPQQTQQQPAGGLFGSTAAAQPQQAGAAQPQQAGGLFGGTAAAQPAQTGGLFGSAAPAASQPQQTGSAFGASANNTAAAGSTGGLFGNAPTAAPTTSAFGQSKPAGSMFGSTQQTNPQNVVPGVRIDVSNIRSTTRFNDLQEDLQKQITGLDEAIQKCMKDCDAINAFMPSHHEQLDAIPRDVTFVSRKWDGTQAALTSDVAAVKQLRDLVREDCDGARLSFRTIDNQKLPTQYHQAGLWSTRGQQASGPSAEQDSETTADLIGFFSKTADEMDRTMKRYGNNLAEIELHLRGLQDNMLGEMARLSAVSREGGQGSANREADLIAFLRELEDGIFKVAGTVGGAREGMTGLQLGDYMGNGTSGMR